MKNKENLLLNVMFITGILAAVGSSAWVITYLTVSNGVMILGAYSIITLLVGSYFGARQYTLFNVNVAAMLFASALLFVFGL